MINKKKLIGLWAEVLLCCTNEGAGKPDSSQKYHCSLLAEHLASCHRTGSEGSFSHKGLFESWEDAA